MAFSVGGIRRKLSLETWFRSSTILQDLQICSEHVKLAGNKRAAGLGEDITFMSVPSVDKLKHGPAVVFSNVLQRPSGDGPQRPVCQFKGKEVCVFSWDWWNLNWFFFVTDHYNQGILKFVCFMIHFSTIYNVRKGFSVSQHVVVHLKKKKKDYRTKVLFFF